jgi:hypothetical protein
MNILRNKSKVSTITLVLVLTFAATLVALPIVSAHDPQWTIPTYAYLEAFPSPIGQGQSIYVFGWLDKYPPTAVGAYGDRWHDLTVTVWRPDGETEVLGPQNTDPTGTVYHLYTPTMVGTYQFQLDFPGQTLIGENLHPTSPTGRVYIGDYYEPSTSEKVSVTVQEDPIQHYEPPPLPTDYWTRPISQELKGWGEQIGGSFLGIKLQMPINYHTTAPETSHIVWTRPITFGGSVGGDLGDTGYYPGQSYEFYWGQRSGGAPIIINGVLYYNVEQPPRYGYYAIDLRTGEELWWHNSTGPITEGVGWSSSGNYPQINYGQLFSYNSPNQHGVIPYLWLTSGSTWQMHDAFTGNWICNVENVPSTGPRFGPLLIFTGDTVNMQIPHVEETVITDNAGDLQILNIGSNNGWLALWSVFRTIQYREAWTSNEFWMWRPLLGKTVDGRNGYVWNVTLPAEIPSTAVVAGVDHENRILLLSTGLEYLGRGVFPTSDTFTQCAISFEEGQEGELLWIENQPWPVGNVSLIPGPTVDGVYTLFVKETRQWYGYDTKNGELLWGPTDSETALHSYKRYEDWSSIAYGKLFSADFWGGGGALYCYNVITGEHLWTYEAESLGLGVYWPSATANLGFIADEKVYLYTIEHSPNPSLWAGGKLRCVDTETGDELWKISFWGNQPAVADGYLVDVNAYDNQIYCFGKGLTEITITAPDVAQPLGTPILLKGTVHDKSPGTEQDIVAGKYPNGVPAIADEYMTEWMEYIYMQKPCPEYAEGVEVVITTLDPNGNTYELDRTTTSLSGTFGCAINPPVPGLYKIIATFEGSDSYYGSYAETYITIGEAPTAAQPIEPEPTTPEPTEPEPTEPTPTEPTPTEPEPTTPEPTEPESTEPAEAPFITTELAILTAVAVAAIIGAVSVYMLRKRK